MKIDTRVVVDVRSLSSTSPYSIIGDISRPMAQPVPRGPMGPPPHPYPHPGLLPNMQKSRPNESEGWVSDYGEGLANCGCDKCQNARPHPPLNFPWTDYDNLNPLNQESLELPGNFLDRDHRYLLYERSIWGFVLNARTWGKMNRVSMTFMIDYLHQTIAKLDPAYCREPTINTAAIASLVMPDERKRMIKAIVQKYVDPNFTPGLTRDHWSADFIKNKGEGQIFLLYGGPGVGQTFVCAHIYTYTPSEADSSTDSRQVVLGLTNNPSFLKLTYSRMYLREYR
jgi:hypothetical protein